MRLFMTFANIAVAVAVTVAIATAALGSLALSTALGPASPVQAQDGEIRVLSHQVETNFPKSVNFTVEVTGPDEIDEIRVYLKTIGQTNRSAYRQVEFEPGTTISGEAELLTSGNNYVPPGTRMAYSFEIRDTAGRVLRTEEEIFVYLDTRFEWFTLSEGIITVYYNNPLVESRARHVLETAQVTLERMGPVLGIQPEVPLHIVTYHNYRDMIGALPFRSQATREQNWTPGMAFDEERVLMVHSGDRSVTSTTAHEFVHLLVGDATGRAYSRVPGWLNEGLAEYGDLQGDKDMLLNPKVERLLRLNKLRPLWHQGTFSGTPEEIVLAYGHGESVVTFLILNYGEAKMAELMQAITRTLDIDKALKQVYGIDQYELDSAWRQPLGLEPLPRPQETTPTPRPKLAPRTTPEPNISIPTFEPPPRSHTPTAQPQATVAAEPTAPKPSPTAASMASAAEPSAPDNNPSGAAPAPNTSGEGEEGNAPGGWGPPALLIGIVGVIALLALLFSLLAVLAVRRGYRKR